MAKKTRKSTKASGPARKKSSVRSKAKKAATPRHPSGSPTALKGRTQWPAAKPRAKRRAGVAGFAAAPATVAVTMTLDFGKGVPNDIQSIRRIDTTDLAGSGTSVNPGKHTVGWDVLSPTVRPIGFAVTVVEDATGKKLFERKGQQAGADGRGAGAGTFTV